MRLGSFNIYNFYMRPRRGKYRRRDMSYTINIFGSEEASYSRLLKRWAQKRLVPLDKRPKKCYHKYGRPCNVRPIVLKVKPKRLRYWG